MRLFYNWINEIYPTRDYTCINVHRPCQMSDCPAWYSEDGFGRCLLVPGYMLHEDEE
jgi:hypothetical protein